MISPMSQGNLTTFANGPPILQDLRPGLSPNSIVHTNTPQVISPMSQDNFDDRVQNVTLSEESIQIEFTRESYKEKFSHLICWEERTHIIILGEK